MKFFTTLTVTIIAAVKAAAVASTPEAAEGSALVAAIESPLAVEKQRDGLHPDNFPNIQAAQVFHDLIKKIYPFVDNAAELAGIEMKDLLDGTPLEWDEAFAQSPGQIERRSFLEAIPLMKEASIIMLGFIARAAAFAGQDMISNIAETLVDHIT